MCQIQVYNYNMSTQQDRLLKGWLNYNCAQGNNWIVVYKFSEIVNHPNRETFRVVGHKKIIPSVMVDVQNMTHVYFTYMTESLLITVIETNTGALYLIKNQMSVKDVSVKDVSGDDVQLPNIESIKSQIYMLGNIIDIRVVLSKRERKLVGIKDNEWSENVTRLKKVEMDELSQTCYLDFINIPTTEQYKSMLNRWIIESGDTVNFIYNNSVNPEMLSSLDVYPTVKQIIIHQNFLLNDFQWLSKFPNIKLINIFYCHQLEQKHFEQIVLHAPQLEVVNIHYCTRINVRVLIPLLRLSHIYKLLIEDSEFWIQKSVHELFIKPEEWKVISCPSLQKVAINSYNLTLDVIDYLLTSCPNIDQFATDDKVMYQIGKNIFGGVENEVVIFNSWQNPAKGMEIHRKMRFNNLLKNTYNSQLFSDSMLKKIQQIKTNKGEKEQTAIV